MSEFRGTKGKWEFYPISEESNGYISVEIQMGSIMVYNGIYPYTFSEDKEKSIEILEANAKLIACAPEMLEMLENVVTWYGKRDFKTNELYSSNFQEPLIKEAMQLIKKATEL